MYKLVRDGCAEHARRLIRALEDAPNDARLYAATVQATWTDFCAQMGLLRAVFSYLERHMPTPEDGIPSIPLPDLGTRIFGDELCAATDALGRTVSAVVTLIQAERNGEAVDRSAVATIVRMLTSVEGHVRPGGVYSSHCEPSLVRSSDLYYEAEGAAEMERKQAPEYLLHAQQRLNEEVSTKVAKCHLTPCRLPLT